jgi:hypothetical protein
MSLDVINYDNMVDIAGRTGSGILFPTDHPLRLDSMIGRAADVERTATSLLGGANVVMPARAV